MSGLSKASSSLTSELAASFLVLLYVDACGLYYLTFLFNTFIFVAFVASVQLSF